MSDPGPSESELALVRRAIARLRAGIMAIVCGMLGGTALFVATAWLVIRGGPGVGTHLGLLRYYFPGYTVTWPGALLGLLYGVVVGAVVGGLVAWAYNAVAGWRNGRGA